jgi:tRNA(Arg) A34 adenosine deaminase TadA
VDKVSPKKVRGSCRPNSAVVQLIQLVFETHKDQSFFLLRNRIYTTANLTDLDLATVKLMAKRCSQVQASSERACLDIEGLTFRELEPDRLQLPGAAGAATGLLGKAVKTKEEARAVLLFLEGEVVRTGDLHDCHRALACFLVDQEGRVVAAETNQSAHNKILHAETLLCQRYFEKHQDSFPSGSTMYVSLSPCRMCAEMIQGMTTGGGDFFVYYLAQDPGPSARDTCLDRNHRQGFL